MIKINRKLALPTKEPRRLVQAEINTILADAVSAELRRSKDKLKFRDLIEWGFGNFLLLSNPKRAKELGIVLEK